MFHTHTLTPHTLKPLVSYLLVVLRTFWESLITRELQERCFDQKISNSHLVQVYMSKHPDMDAQKVTHRQYITVETLYMTYFRKTNDVLKMTTPRQVDTEEEEIFRKISWSELSSRYCVNVEGQ